MLWLCLYMPRLPLDAAQAPVDAPFAIIGSDRRVQACNAAAETAGVAVGQRLKQALVLCPALRSAQRHPQAERQSVEAVAAWAGQFGSPVTLDARRFLVWVEVGRSLNLFGGWRGLIRRLRTEMQALELDLRHGFAPTLEAAALLAHAGVTRPVVNLQRLRQLIEPWPAVQLPLPPEARALLRGIGVSCIGELLALPSAALTRRLGQDVPAYLARLLGTRDDVWVSYEPPLQYRRRFDFLNEIETVEGLLFPLKRLMVEFSGYLRARDVGVLRWTLRLRHAHRPATVRVMSMLAAAQDAEPMLRLTHERLQREPPPAAVLEIALEALEFLSPEHTQSELFDDGQVRLGLRDVLERLGARLGGAALRTLAPQDDHRPEHAWRQTDIRTLLEAGSVAAPPLARQPRHRPLWLLPRPLKIAPPLLLSGPERIEAGWWETEQRRDYFLAQDTDGRHLWVFRSPDSPQWYLHGYWN